MGNDAEKADLKYFLKFTYSYKRYYITLLSIILLTSLIAAASPYLYKVIVDDGIAGNNLKLAISLICTIFLMELIASGGETIKARLFSYVGQSILMDIRKALFNHFTRMSQSFYIGRSTGELMARIEGDISFLEITITQGLVTLISDVILFLFVAGFIIYLSWQLFLFIAILLPIAFLLQKVIGSKIEQVVIRLRDSAASLSAFLQESISNMRYFQAFAAEKNLQGKYATKMYIYAKSSIELSTTIAVAVAAFGLIGSLGAVIIYSYGGYLVIHHQLTIGALITFSAYFYRLLGPSQRLAKLNLDIKASKAALFRIMGMLEIVPEIRPIGDKKIDIKNRRIEFRNVDFEFDDGEQVFENLNVVLEPSTVNLMIGPSGIGKTTIANLLVRHFDASAGSILIDGIDIREMDLTYLRKQIGIISQEAFLLNVSIKENIAFAKPDASEEEIIEAAKSALIYDYIVSLRGGFETVIGERGLNLSGGQKQRIAIARAILQDPALLILDEATSALDINTEQEVLNELKTFFTGRTVIIISHRFFNLDIVDKVVELKDKQAHEKACISLGLLNKVR